MTAVARSIGHDLGTRQVIVRISPPPPACKVMGCAALRLVKSRSVTAKLAEHRLTLVPPERDKPWGISAARLLANSPPISLTSRVAPDNRHRAWSGAPRPSRRARSQPRELKWRSSPGMSECRRQLNTDHGAARQVVAAGSEPRNFPAAHRIPNGTHHGSFAGWWRSRNLRLRIHLLRQVLHDPERVGSWLPRLIES